MHLLSRALFITLGLLAAGAPLPAADAPKPRLTQEQRQAWLHDHPEARARLRAWLAEHPEARARLRERLRERREGQGTPR